MTDRFCAGLHPILGRGLYLSRAGVAVLGASARSDFMISSSHKQNQLLQTGHVTALALSSSLYIPWKLVLSDAPLVFFQLQIGGDLVSNIPMNPQNGAMPNRMRINAAVTTSGVTFTNNSSTLAHTFWWVAFNKPRP